MDQHGSFAYARKEDLDVASNDDFIPVLILRTWNDESRGTIAMVAFAEADRDFSRNTLIENVPLDDLIDAQEFLLANKITPEDDGGLGEGTDEYNEVAGKTRFFRLATEMSWNDGDIDDATRYF